MRSRSSARAGPLARAALALAAATSAFFGQYSLAVRHDFTAASIGWAVAAGLFILLYWLDSAGRELPDENDSVPLTVEWPLALLILTTGVFYRTFRLSELPPGLNHDVAWNGLYAVQILQGIPYAPYVAAAWGRETFMFYLQALAIRWFGMDLFAMILPAIVAMIVMLPVFYLLARRMFGAPTALAAAMLFAAAGWPLIYGRVGWRAVLQPLFTALTCLYFWRGLRTARVRDFMVSGASLAVTLNTYNGSRTLPLLFPLFAVAYLIRHRQLRKTLRLYWLGVLMMLVAFGVCVAPLAKYAYYHWAAFQGRADALWTGPEAIVPNLRATALIFNYRGNGDDFFIETPILEVPAAVLFVFGLLWCLLRLGDERAAFLLLGLAITVLPGVVSRPNANRCIGAMPFTFLLAGLGLQYFVRQAARLGRAGGALGLLVITLAGAAQARATFVEYLSHTRRRVWGFYPETTVLGRYMATLVGKYAIWVGGANFPRDTLTFFTYPGQGDPFQRQYTWLDDVTVLLQEPPQAPRGRGLAVILSTIDTAPAVFAQMQLRYPVHQVVDLRYPPESNQVFARAMLVAPEEAARHAVENSMAPPTGEPLWTGGRGLQLGKFNTPKGLARGRDGRFYVADTGNHRIQTFDAKGAFVAAWGQPGTAPGSFNEPTAIALDKDGNLHVVDTWNNRVQKLAPSGRVLVVYAPPTGFYGPRGIAVGDERVYVTDGGNNYVFVFDLQGRYLSKFGGPGHEPGQLFQPCGVTVDSDGLIWVVDSGNNQLQVFKPDGSMVKRVPVPHWRGPELKEGYVTTSALGLILSDPVSDRLYRVQGDQVFRLEVQTPLLGPSGLVVEGSTVFVSERGRNAVAKLELPRPSK